MEWGQKVMGMLDYLRDKILLLVLHTGCMLLMAGFLYATGYDPEYCMLILVFWVLILAGWLGYGYYNRKRYFEKLWVMLERMRSEERRVGKECRL